MSGHINDIITNPTRQFFRFIMSTNASHGNQAKKFATEPSKFPSLEVVPSFRTGLQRF